MKKPHEQTLGVMQFDKERRCLVETDGGTRMVAVLRNFDSADWENFLLAAPEMARALDAAVSQVVASHLPVLGPSATADDIAARGQPVLVSAENFAAMVAALRKAVVTP